MSAAERGKKADSDQIAKARERANEMCSHMVDGCSVLMKRDVVSLMLTFAASERQAVIEDYAKMADQIAQSCSACSYSREKHGEEPSFCENFGCSNFADLATAIRSME